MSQVSPEMPDPAADRHALDPAQRSLAEALRITYRIIQGVMVILFALFILSGLETVGEGERGVSLTFGAINQSDLPAGQQFHLPYPVGELVTVHTGSNEIGIDRTFYPGRHESTPPQIRRSRALKPGQDGSLLTGDGAIAHAQWSVVYRVDDAGVSDYVRNVRPSDAAGMVKAAVERGVVRVVAELSIDDFLKQAGVEGAVTGEAAIESRVRLIAQDTLDRIGAGILIERVTLDDRSPPGSVKEIFDEVSRQTSEASKDREEAQQYAREQLNAVAGTAHSELIRLIDEFETLIDQDRVEESEAVLAQIDAILTGDVSVSDDPSMRVSGDVSRTISRAQQYRTDVVTRAQANADRFSAKLGLFRDNPAVFLSNEWAEAYSRFIERSGAQVFAMPRESSMELLLNTDPDIARAAEADRNASQATETMRQRMQDVIDNANRSRGESN